MSDLGPPLKPDLDARLTAEGWVRYPNPLGYAHNTVDAALASIPRVLRAWEAVHD